MKYVIIIAGGDPANWPDLTPYRSNETAFIGVDRGTLYGLKYGLPIKRAVGDFDSLTTEEFGFVQQQVRRIDCCAAEKDDTDTQLGMLAAIEDYPDASYVLIGATGGRLDHFLSNLWLPLQNRFQPFLERIMIRDNLNSIRYFKPGEYIINKEQDKPYLAYVCLTSVDELTIYDAKYRLENTSFPLPFSLSSNEFVGETSRFSFKTGFMCVIQSKDKCRIIGK
ncbi:thiamine diphosphokinase [Vagococcus penaei]|uniref:Thiamine diphosphokinase n=1 Tax=Vagococcus penaei TaxID=633807 RepID=A0A1Q2D9H7_9ENTE|nr:thiamine diphosphokinase [Vagococcus penaei]RSU01758.1 thiamine diphosphokinase [Vagococcus penaei]